MAASQTRLLTPEGWGVLMAIISVLLGYYPSNDGSSHSGGEDIIHPGPRALYSKPWVGHVTSSHLGGEIILKQTLEPRIPF